MSMISIFTDRALLYQEYKSLFLDKLSNHKKVKQCIKSRYGIKKIDDDEFRRIFTNNHKCIYEFIGPRSDNRIRNFFGGSGPGDIRDDQVRLVDRFILDSIHFEIMATLIIQLIKDYPGNEEAINKSWAAELDISTDSALDSLPRIAIIEHIMKNQIKNVFSDLMLPELKRVDLFRVNKNRIIPNEYVFSKWLPASQPPKKYLFNIIFFSMITAAVACGAFAIAAGLGTLSIPILILLVIIPIIFGLVIGVALYNKEGALRNKNRRLVIKETDPIFCGSSYLLIKARIFTVLKQVIGSNTCIMTAKSSESPTVKSSKQLLSKVEEPNEELPYVNNINHGYR